MDASFTDFAIHRSMDGPMRLICLAACLLALATTANAHHPDRENQPVHQRIDVIGPLGNCLPMSYRRRYNRPTNIGGRIAYYVAPSSLEAMAWHDATHRGLYENDRPRTEMHYFYPKPYEALRIGNRPKPESDRGTSAYGANNRAGSDDAPELDTDSDLMDAKDAVEDSLRQLEPAAGGTSLDEGFDE